MHMTAGQIATVASGRVVGDSAATASSWTNDTRTLERGACFVALVGERDGHDFVLSAFEAGAAVALVSRAVDSAIVPPGAAVVIVDDPLTALTDAARAMRQGYEGVLVAITGSTGKTSTKDLLASALAGSARVHAAAESHNNELGLPLTLLNAPESTDVVVAEMGARFAGNITQLCEIAGPHVGVVTNVGLAHAEHLGGPAGVATVKGELIAALPPDGFAVLNADDAGARGLADRTRARIVLTGRARTADVRVVDAVVGDDLRAHVRFETPSGPLETTLGLRGAHQVQNAALAVGVAVALGHDLVNVGEGLARATGSRWRMEVDTSPGGVTILNDAYNANPASMDAALVALESLPVTGRRVAVLGEMRELGDHSLEAHARVGASAALHHVDLLVTVGEAGEWIARASGAGDVLVVGDAAGALAALRGRLRSGDAVLVKASRAVGLEAVAEALSAGAGDYEADRAMGADA